MPLFCWRKLELGVNWSKASKGSSLVLPKADKRPVDNSLHHDSLLCNITGGLIIGGFKDYSVYWSFWSWHGIRKAVRVMLCIIHCGFLGRRALGERGIYTCSMASVKVL
jgi:hypothetical protein